MRITLVSFDSELFCYSLRILSSCLKKAGYRVNVVILTPPVSGNTKNKFRTTYSDVLLDQLVSLCSGSLFVGVSFMSNQFIQAINVTEGLKSRGVNVPVVWGGVQPTVEPEECLNYNDIVCVGEGETAIVELADCLRDGKSYSGIKNLWLRTPAGLIKNSLNPLIQDLDEIPFPDYSCTDHYISQGDSLVALTKEVFIRFQGERFRAGTNGIIYMFLTSRGCPYRCTYCINSTYEQLYPGQKRIRWRSNENIVEELKVIRSDIAPLDYVAMVDDNFTARSAEKLLSFCTLFKKEIGVPFNAQVSPLTIDEEKLDILFKHGCSHITMGVETATGRIAEMYNRQAFHKVTGRAIAMIEKYRHLQAPPPTYQFIIDNPWETLDEMLQTLRMACSFPRPWSNPIYSLMLFPGVPLFFKAIEEGLITDKFNQIYGRHWRLHSRPYLQLWIRLYHANMHPFILKFMLLKPVAVVFSSKPMEILFKFKLFRFLWEAPS